MVKSYFRHNPTDLYGLITHSPHQSANSIYLTNNTAYVPALEDVLLWDVKLGSQLAMLHTVGSRALVSCMTLSPNSKELAVGYQDGTIRLWNLETRDCRVTFEAHKKAISALRYDESGSRLASGSQDTDIVLWDCLAEQGLFRLKGHKDQITTLQFASEDFLSSGSKDTLLKLWYLPTQHCVDTMVAHRSECWSSVVVPFAAVEGNSAILLTSGSEGELKLWLLDLVSLTLTESSSRHIKPLTPPTSLSSLTHAHAVRSVAYDPVTGMVALQTSEKTLEFARVRSAEEIRKKMARRKRREGNKKTSKLDMNGDAGETEEEVALSDRLTSWTVLRSVAKIKAFSFAQPASSREARGKSRSSASSKDAFSVLLALSNNALQTYTIPLPSNEKSKEVECTVQFTLSVPGHRNDIRSICLSSDDNLVASVSNGQLKVWNRRTLNCVRTIEDVGYGLCAEFLPGDHHIVIGTKDGNLELYDLASSSSIYKVEKAHHGPIWSLQITPNGQSLITGSSDKSVKWWNFAVLNVVANGVANGDAEGKQRRLELKHIKTLKLTDDVLSVRISPDSRLLAVATLDFTVKIFYADSFKFFLSLYGHKLPVISMDISHDSSILVTASADKNIKVWGLKFGDCHVSLFGHQDTVMSVAFEADSLNFYSVSKDAVLKYWDAEKFECIQKLEGHHADILALATSRKGKFVITASSDKSIRIWEKTDEPLFIEEEREKELEDLYNSNTSNDPFALGISKSGLDGEEQEAEEVISSTLASLTSGEKIIEALELSASDRQAIQEAAVNKTTREPRNPLLAIKGEDCTAEKYVFEVVMKIPSSHLTDALLVLPFSKIPELVHHLSYWIKRRWNIPLISRVLFFVLKTHHSEIVATKSLRDQLLTLRSDLRISLSLQKDILGYNLAALKVMQKQQDENRTSSILEKTGLVDEVGLRAAIDDGVKKRKRAIQ